jgi:CheY-like chemotaxis protein
MDSEYRVQTAETARRRAAELVASMNHDVRTPLNVIMGMSGLLLNSDIGPKQRTWVESIKRSADLLFKQISDIMDFAKMEAGRLKPEEKRFDLEKILDNAVKGIHEGLDQKSIETRWQFDFPLYLKGDPHCVEKIVCGLLDWAIHCAGPRPVLQGFRDPDEGEQAVIHFFIPDAGDSLSLEGDGINAGKPDLGFVVVRGLTEMMGGRIWRDDLCGKKGLHLIIKAEKGPECSPSSPFLNPDTLYAGKTASPCQLEGRGLNILVAEDNPSGQQILTFFLGKKGHQISVVENGQAAVNAVRTGKFDLILMDIQMPMMDGLKAARAIREQEKLGGGRIPIVAITADVMAKDVQAYREAGMDSHISKPFKYQELYDLIEEMAYGRREESV